MDCLVLCPGIPSQSLLLYRRSTSCSSETPEEHDAQGFGLGQVSARTVLLATGFWSVRRVKVDGGEGSFVASNTQVACSCDHILLMGASTSAAMWRSPGSRVVHLLTLHWLIARCRARGSWHAVSGGGRKPGSQWLWAPLSATI